MSIFPLARTRSWNQSSLFGVSTIRVRRQYTTTKRRWFVTTIPRIVASSRISWRIAKKSRLDYRRKRETASRDTNDHDARRETQMYILDPDEHRSLIEDEPNEEDSNDGSAHSGEWGRWSRGDESGSRVRRPKRSGLVQGHALVLLLYTKMRWRPTLNWGVC